MIIPPDERAITLNKFHAPAANNAAIVTIDAATDDAWIIDEIHVSIDITFSAARKFNVTFNAVEKFAVDLKTAGLYVFQFRRGLMTRTKNHAVVATLAADANGSGSVNVNYR